VFLQAKCSSCHPTNSDKALTHTHTHTRLTALFPGLPGWASTRKVKPIGILLKQETVSGSGISWAIYKSAPCSRQITTPEPQLSFFTGQMPFLPPNRQRQSTDKALNETQSTAPVNSGNASSFLHSRQHSTRKGHCSLLQLTIPIPCSSPVNVAIWLCFTS